MVDRVLRKKSLHGVIATTMGGGPGSLEYFVPYTLYNLTPKKNPRF